MRHRRDHTTAESAWLWHMPGRDALPLMRAAYRAHAFPRHMHPTFVIEVVESGVDEFECGGAVHRAAPGDVVVINPFQVHTGRAGNGAMLTYRSLYPGTALMSRLSACGNESQVPLFPESVIADRSLAQALLRAHRRSETDPPSAAALHELWSVLADLGTRYAACRCPVRSERTAVARARTFILDHVRENTPLGRLADLAGMSSCHFARVFAQEVGLPPHEYLVNVRVERAKCLLATGEEIAQVAHRVGFADQSHLGRCFRRIVGCTPAGYRRKIVLDRRVPSVVASA